MSILAVTGFDCGGEGVLKVIKFIFTLLDMVLFIIPMALIVMLSVDLVKNVIAGNTDAMGKNFKLAIKRILMCMALFLVQPIVHFSINLLGNLGVDFLQCVEISLNDDLSQYKIEYSKDDSVGVSEPNFNQSSGYTPSNKNGNTSEASG